MSLHISNKAPALHTVIAKSHSREHTATELLDPEKVKANTCAVWLRINRSFHCTAAPSNTRTRTPKTNHVQPVSWDSQPKASHQEVTSGSWASIASSKQQQDDTNDDGWNNSNANNNDSSSAAAAAAAASDDWAPAPTTSSNDDNANDDQPKTWASLLK